MTVDKHLSDYEIERLRRIADNKRKLAELGLDKKPSEKSQKKKRAPPLRLSLDRRTSTRDRKTVCHTSFAGLDVKGKGTADAGYVYNQDEDDDDEEDAMDDVVSDDGMPASRGRCAKRNTFEHREDGGVGALRRLPMPVAPSTLSSTPPVAVNDGDHALATMLANISNYTFTSTSPFQPNIPLLGDGKLQCSVCKGRFVPKQGSIMRQHQDVQYGGICRGSGAQIAM